MTDPELAAIVEKIDSMAQGLETWQDESESNEPPFEDGWMEFLD